MLTICLVSFLLVGSYYAFNSNFLPTQALSSASLATGIICAAIYCGLSVIQKKSEREKNQAVIKFGLFDLVMEALLVSSAVWMLVGLILPNVLTSLLGNPYSQAFTGEIKTKEGGAFAAAMF